MPADNIVLKKDDTVLIAHVESAVTIRTRMRGLLGRSSLDRDKAMWISPCSCVHTFGMRFNLDLVFLDKSQMVLRIVRNVPSNRIISGGWSARSVLEFQNGWFLWDKLREGDRVHLGG
jgi:uncharacterized protein